MAAPVAKCDIYLCHDDRWVTGYQRAWSEDRFWFCPPDNADKPFIRVSRHGLQFTTHSPLADARGLDGGLYLANPPHAQWQEAA
ncbi:hypothetical protein EDF58_102500 [Novosphingobium sp. PhB57]|uniref:hypothetical protein n=1 Tax=Novosphingobium sp. PhB57 TaxID=2485107 RepID=UPI0010EA23AF|nr:hypothetical protein [Novosphingobium sp. PhB57]TCU59812.1 hypothetical protein EDF58_102500 [Novosphingobium sp. PhB57]